MKVTNTLDLNGYKAINVLDPANPQDAATKNYVDSAIQGLKWKEPVRAASTANVTLSGLQTIDGVSLIANDRVLLKNQSTPSQNGIYIAASGSWNRATDFDANSEILGASVFVSEGSTLGNTQWLMTTDGPITVGSTALTWIQFGGSGTFVAGNGISLSGATIAVDPAVVARKASATIGDGSATAFNVVHNLNTTDPMVVVHEAGGGKNAVIADWAITDANTVTVTFGTAPTTGQYRVTVIG